MKWVGSQSSHARPRRLLHFVSTFKLKTDTKWLIQLSRHLDRREFSTSVACFYDGDGAARPQLDRLGVRTYCLDVPGDLDPRAIWRAQRLIREIRPEIIHTHLLRADLYGAAAGRLAGVPVVSTAYAIGEFRRATRRWCDPLLDQACAALPTHTIAVSEAVRLDCVERLGMPPDEVSVIRTGIDPPPEPAAFQIAEARSALGVAEGDELVLAVARLSYEKGLETLIEAAALLRRRRPRLHLVVLGEGPQGGMLQKRITDLKLGGTVRLLGHVDDVWTALAAAEVFCLPSKSEGLPNALLEAMAMRCPIVATAVGGVPEAIVCGENGLLVPPADPVALAEATARLLEHRQVAKRLGQSARQTIERRFLARDVAARYASLYTALIREGKEAHVGALATH